MSAESPGRVREFALRVYRNLPAAPSQQIVRFIAPQFVIGAVVLIEHEGLVLTLQQTHRIGLSLPGGLLDGGETPEEAVAREVREETGLDIDPGDPVATVFDPNKRHVDVIYRVCCDERPQVRPSSEATGFSWIDPADWPGERDESTERIMNAVTAARATPRAGRLL